MESSVMSVETCKGEMSHFDVRQRADSTHSSERGFQPGCFATKWKLLSSDRLLPRYTFPPEGDTFLSLWAKTAFGSQT